MNLHPRHRSKKKKKDPPTPAGYKAARLAECGKDRCGRPLATRPRGCERRAPAARPRRRDPSPPHHRPRRRLRFPARPPRSQPRWPPAEGCRGHTGRPCRRCLARTRRGLLGGAERGEKGVNPEVHRPPASRRQLAGDKSGPAKEGPAKEGPAPASARPLAARPVPLRTWPCPPPPGRAPSFPPAPRHRAPLDVAHVPDRAAGRVAPARTPGRTRARTAAGRAAYLQGLMVAR